jgi:hypothetical protein
MARSFVKAARSPSSPTRCLVGRATPGAHDLLRMALRVRILAWAGESQYYVKPRRLARLGDREARKEPGKTRERTGLRAHR